MKPIGRRGKQLMLLGIAALAICLMLAVYLKLALPNDSLQKQYEAFQIGEWWGDNWKGGSAYVEGRKLTFIRADLVNQIASETRHVGTTDKVITFLEPDGLLLPTGMIILVEDGETGRIKEKSIHRPNMSQIWSHWMRKIGL
jgi:hypothetical protein